MGGGHNFANMICNPVRVVLCCAFWAPMLPLASFWGVVMLTFDYWTVKYKFLRRSVRG